MNREEIIDRTSRYVQEVLAHAEAGHDWWHISRVLNNTRQILASEAGADALVCELAALLHDIADKKFHEGDQDLGPRLTRYFLNSLGVDPLVIEQVVFIVANVGFTESLAQAAGAGKELPQDRLPIELQIVQDADRLDALGAIGIARAFHYGGFKNRLLYRPDMAPMENFDAEAYKKSTGPTLNHFHEKLFKLKNLMHTDAGRKLAENRHRYMEEFVEQFLKEWSGKAE